MKANNVIMGRDMLKPVTHYSEEIESFPGEPLKLILCFHVEKPKDTHSENQLPVSWCDVMNVPLVTGSYPTLCCLETI